ncbi:unnamed protein product [Dracunculus medinensis]|uniref:SCAPER_N domain-containing protein n=1 Tax=Dracunculus medinensis TaxID=318479 RepID=A0A0N4UB81_DRAME|nr:unnamed protein product [Dracunculus medinensis]
MTMKYKNEIELSLVKQRNKKDERAADKRQQAKCWTYYVETLKRTIDCLYEICRSEQSIIGCKEALMYLANSVRDFEALIETINVEVAWEDKVKPHSVAWEIRKTMSATLNKSIMEGSQDTDSLIDVLKL